MKLHIEFDPKIIDQIKETIISESVSSYVRRSVEQQLVRDGAILLRPDTQAQIVPISYVVEYRSADGNLNSETIAAKDELDARGVFEGSTIVSVTKK